MPRSAGLTNGKDIKPLSALRQETTRETVEPQPFEGRDKDKFDGKKDGKGFEDKKG
jgi:hypothetical protein